MNLDVSVTISDLVIGNNDVLSINDARSLTIDNVGGGINIFGQLNLDSSGSNTSLAFSGGDLSFTGGGNFNLSNHTTNRIFSTINTDRLTLEATMTLTGAGQIGLGQTKLTNRGTMNANQSNTLTIDPTDGAGGVINSGVMKATVGGTLVLQGGSFENSEGMTNGEIQADNATVNVSSSSVTGGVVTIVGTGEIKLNTGTISGGTVTNSATGIIRSDSGSSTLGGIVNNVGGGQIIIDDATTLTLVNTGTYTNNGDLLVNSAGNNTTLTVGGGEVTVGGTGTITLSNFTTNRILGAVNTDRLVLGVDQTLAGAGQIGVGTMKLTNHGTINANQSNLLTIDPTNGAQGVINSGTLKATGGRTLVLQGGTFENFDGGTLGQILADNATVNVSASTVSGGMVATLGTGELKLNSSAVTGGTVNNSATGIIRSDTSTNTLGGIVTNVGGGQIIIDDATTLTLVNTGTYTNDGDLALNSAGNNTTLTVSGGEVTVGGTGTMTLSNFTTNRILGAVNTDRLVLGVDQTLAGAGQIGVGTMKLTNHGTINANQSNLPTIDPTNGAQGVINSGTLKATGGRTLVLQGGTFENFDGGTLGQILADNATVNVSASTVSGGMVATLGTGELKLNSSAVTGGTVNNSATGIIRSDTSTNTLGGIVTNVGGGQIIVDDATTLTLVNTGTYTNEGDLALNSAGSNTTLTVSGGEVTVGGTGTITLSNFTTNRILGAVNTDRLVLGVDQTLAGAGQIGVGTMKLTNHGTINANQSNLLTIDPTNGAQGVINSGTLKATGGRTLVLQGGTFENFDGGTLGQILADNATVNVSASTVSGGMVATLGTGELKLNSSAVTGGTVNNSATGIIRSDTSTNTLGGIVTNVGGGQIIVDDATTLTLVNTGTYTNEGDLALNSAGSNTTLTVSGGDVTIGGTGTITLSNFTTNRILGAINTDRLILGVDQTLAGAGQIGVGTMKLTNHGTINANQSNLLTIDPTNGAQGVINSGTLKATGGRTLLLQGGAFENFDGGTSGQILADSAIVNVSASTVSGGTVATLGTGELKLNSSAVNGGTVNNSATGIIRSDSGLNTLGGIVTNVGGGQIIVDDATTLTLVNTGTYTNEGDLALNSAGSNTTTVSGGDVTIGGTGTITLSNLTTNRILGAVNTHRLILGAGQTLWGAGQIGLGTMNLTNNGTIDANQTSTLTINVTGNAFSNAGTLRASAGANLTLSDTSVTNTGTVEVAGSTSQVSAAGSYTQTAGTTRLEDGTLVVAGIANFMFGSLTGSGTVAAAGGSIFGVNASISAGASPGILNFTDATVFDGQIDVELGGINVDGAAPNAGIINTGTNPATTEFDQLNIFGLATLTPGLTFDLASFGGFNPAIDDFFDVLTADNFNAGLDLGTLNFISSSFNINQFNREIVTLDDAGATRQALRLTSLVPIPATVWLLGFGLVGVFGIAKRQHSAS